MSPVAAVGFTGCVATDTSQKAVTDTSQKMSPLQPVSAAVGDYTTWPVLMLARCACWLAEVVLLSLWERRTCSSLTMAAVLLQNSSEERVDDILT